MSKQITIEDLGAAYKAAARAYDDSDLMFMEWVRTADVEEFIADMDAYLDGNNFDSLAPGVRDIYVKAKTWVIACDQGLDAALLWKLSYV